MNVQYSRLFARFNCDAKMAIDPFSAGLDLKEDCMDTRIQVDEVDLKLLTQLQQDASLSNQALAERVGISPATSLRRVKRLSEAGVIERTVSVLSPEALGHGLTAIVE